MKPSSFQTAIRLQFDCLVKRVIDTTVKDYQRELSRRATHEIAFSELPEQELNHVGITDDYDSDYSCFEVLGTKVKVNNEQLADALKILPEKKLDILLMFYFFWKCRTLKLLICYRLTVALLSATVEVHWKKSKSIYRRTNDEIRRQMPVFYCYISFGRW